MSATIPFSIQARADDTLEAMLSPVHDRWIEQLEQVLAPAIAPKASFWERWGVVRYLVDQFESCFRRGSLFAGLRRTRRSAALMGYTGAVFERFFGSLLGTALTIGALLLWCAGPLLAARQRFCRKDF